MVPLHKNMPGACFSTAYSVEEKRFFFFFTDLFRLPRPRAGRNRRAEADGRRKQPGSTHVSQQPERSTRVPSPRARGQRQVVAQQVGLVSGRKTKQGGGACGGGGGGPY